VNAESKKVEDPNELVLARWGVVVKDPNDPNELLRSRWDAVIKVLRAKKLDSKAKVAEISKIVTPIFDFPLMAKLALGRKHWPKLTADQRAEFTKLFIERLKASYTSKVKLYKDERVMYKRPIAKKKNLIYIPTKLVCKDQDVDILYKLHKSNDRWKIYDVEIQGVSILLTYRSQFDDILSRGTVEQLLSKLRNPSKH